MQPLKPAIVLSLTFLLVGACVAQGGEDIGELESLQQELNNSPTEQLPTVERLRGTMVVMDPMYEQDLVDNAAAQVGTIAAAAPTIIYMNRQGGTYSPGQNDARTNRSSMAPRTVNVPPASMSDNNWNQVMACFREQFAAYNVEVTDVDPGSVPHYESVVAGSPILLDMPENVGGVSPFTSGCDVIPNSIVFTFADVLPDNPQVLCEIAAQEVAHSFGLDHEYLCSDPMTYLNGCGAKSFQNVAASCGESTARACAQPGQYDCGYAKQNSVQLLSQRLGTKPGPLEAAIASPVDGASVNAGFELTVTTNAESVELRIDGSKHGTLNAPPFAFATPSGLAAGTHVLEIIADGTITDSISITVQSGGDGNGNSDGNVTPEPGNPSNPDPSNPDPDGTGGSTDGPGLVTGGCSTHGSGGSSSTILLLLGLGLLATRRRRYKN